MAEARSRADWARTAGVMWLIAEANRNPKKRSRPFTPTTFNPYAQKRPRPVSVERLTRDILKVADAKTRGTRRPSR